MPARLFPRGSGHRTFRARTVVSGSTSTPRCGRTASLQLAPRSTSTTDHASGPMRAAAMSGLSPWFPRHDCRTPAKSPRRSRRNNCSRYLCRPRLRSRAQVPSTCSGSPQRERQVLLPRDGGCPATGCGARCGGWRMRRSRTARLTWLTVGRLPGLMSARPMVSWCCGFRVRRAAGGRFARIGDRGGSVRCG